MTEPIEPEGFTTERPNSPQNVPQICSICGLYYQGHGNNAQPINAGRCCDRCDALVSYRRINDQYGHDMPASLLEDLQGMQELVDRLWKRGSEPFWMQDIRLAQARLEARRIAARSTDQAASSSEDESSIGSP